MLFQSNKKSVNNEKKNKFTQKKKNNIKLEWLLKQYTAFILTGKLRSY